MANVLLIDDDSVSRELLTLLLSAAGHRITSAPDGAAALVILHSAAFDAILTDLRMPGLAGAALAAQLRTRSPRSRLLAMSASRPSPADAAAFDAFLLKPFDAAAFDAAFKSRSAVSATSAAAPDLDESTYARLAAAMPLADLDRLFALALEDTRTRAAAIDAALNSGELAAAIAQAHAIKGSAAMLGARALAAAAGALELAGNPSDARLYLAQILACTVRLEGILSSRSTRT
jgi:CheY-like chemotaxis protein